MMKHKLVIVTDEGLFKAYRLERTRLGTPRLEPLEQQMLAGARTRVAESLSDMAGQRGSTTGQFGGSTVNDGNHLRLETRRRLVRQIAGRIEALLAQNDYEGAWLAAEKEINRAILEELPAGVRNRIEQNLPCDLTKTRRQQLLEHFGAGPS